MTQPSSAPPPPQSSPPQGQSIPPPAQSYSVPPGMRSRALQQPTMVPQSDYGQPIPVYTKTGRIDRRFKGFRETPPEEEANINYRRPAQGGMIGDIHVSLSGAPDRRFVENRGLTEDEAMRRYSEVLYERYHQQQ